MADNYKERSERLKELFEDLKAKQGGLIKPPAKADPIYYFSNTPQAAPPKKSYQYTQEELTNIPPKLLLEQILKENQRIYLAKSAKRKATWEYNPNPAGQDPIHFDVPYAPRPGHGDSPGGYCITDKEHNILDIWDTTSEVEACEKFNKLEKPPTLKDKAIFLIPVSREGKGCGVIGSK